MFTVTATASAYTSLAAPVNLNTTGTRSFCSDQSVHVEHEHIYQAIIDSAKANDCDLITMTSHGRRGVSALVLGSETVKLLTHSTIPVLVHR